MSRVTDRAAFESWYAEHAFDLGANPIGSRECNLQWKAWVACRQALAPLLSGARDKLAACNCPSWPDRLDDEIDAP